MKRSAKAAPWDVWDGAAVLLAWVDQSVLSLKALSYMICGVNFSRRRVARQGQLMGDPRYRNVARKIMVVNDRRIAYHFNGVLSVYLCRFSVALW